MFQTVDGIIRGADQSHPTLRHEAPRRVARLGQLRARLFPDHIGRVGRQALGDAEIARQFQMGPIVERIAQQIRHRRGKSLKLIMVRGVSRDQRLVNSI